MFSPPSSLCVFIYRATSSAARFTALTSPVPSYSRSPGSFPPRVKDACKISHPVESLRLYSCHVVTSAQMHFRSAEEKGDVLGRAYSTERRRRTNGAGERSLCAAAGPSAAHRGRGNKRQCARSSDTKPGHAEIMRPAQWVANKRGALLILHQLIFTAHLNPSLEFDKFSRKTRGPGPFLNPLGEQVGLLFY